jgi:hypothetical protein
VESTGGRSGSGNEVSPDALTLWVRISAISLFDYYGSYLDLNRKLHLLLNAVSMRLNLGTR